MIYGWLYRSSLYRAFLRHRVWAWSRMLVLPIFAPFYLLSIPIVWFALPQLFMILLLIVMSVQFPSAAIMDRIAIVQYGLLIMFAPITLRAAFALFTGFFPMGDAFVGNGRAAKEKLASAQKDLENWNT